MRCALVFYLVLTIFVIVYSSRELCVIEENGGNENCARDIFDYIPPISQNISHLVLKRQPLKQLPYNAFRNLSSQSTVAYIKLEECQISHVDAGALVNLRNLAKIDLSHNQITQIDSKLFRHTKRITNIDMQHNKIEVVPRGLFENLPLLKIVYLYDNRISRVERFSFKDTPALEIIDLEYNQLEFMNALFKDELGKLTRLKLAGNPWRCNCKLAPLNAVLVQTNLLNQYGPECERPPKLHGRKWSDISRDEFVCASERRSEARRMEWSRAYDAARNIYRK